jgi:putative SOS response-associated peptidase YedK
MCGRYNLQTTGVEIAKSFDALWDGEYEPNYNVAPTTNQPVIAFSKEGERAMKLFRWGLVPFWADDPGIGARMINARSETIAEKPSFRTAFKRRRCIVPASAFYEWKREGDAKQPYQIIPANDDFFAFAGIWERWDDDEGNALFSYSILTCDANERMQELHHRMPVILHREEIDTWLHIQKDDNTEGLDELLRPFPETEIDFFPVSKAVGNVRNNDETLTEPIKLQEADDRDGQTSIQLGD